MRRAIVRLDGLRVGVLAEEAGAGTAFTYDRAWVDRGGAPVSLTLPLREAPYPWKTGLHPFFENLLPEGWLLELSTKALKISKDDAFGLLLATGADCAGAVEVVPDEEAA